MSPLSCPQIYTLPGRCASYLLLHWPRKGGELHGLSFWICRSRGLKSCTFSYLPDFVAKTQNHSVHDPHFDEFTIPTLDYSVGGDWDEFLLCPIRAFKRYMARIVLVSPAFLFPCPRGRRGCPEN